MNAGCESIFTVYEFNSQKAMFRFMKDVGLDPMVQSVVLTSNSSGFDLLHLDLVCYTPDPIQHRCSSSSSGVLFWHHQVSLIHTCKIIILPSCKEWLCFNCFLVRNGQM